MSRLLSATFLIALMPGIAPAQDAPPPQPAPAAPRPQRQPPPTRDPKTPGYVTAKDLPDGEIPSPKVEGNFIIGPTHNPAPEMNVQEGVPQGTISTFTMESADSKFYPGIARDPNTGAGQGPITAHPQPHCRKGTGHGPQHA